MKDIKNYEGLYAITSCGKVWSYKSKRFLTPQDNGCGYLQVTLCKNGDKKRHYVHRLVAAAYIPNPNNLPQINHKDENKKNNCISNLEWCDSKYNNSYGTKAERSAEKQRKPIRDLDTNEVYKDLREASKITGVCTADISKVCNGVYRQSKGHHFMFEKDYQNILVAELLEAAFFNSEVEKDGSEMISICGVPLNDYFVNEVSY